jgi:hypothetical protein
MIYTKKDNTYFAKPKDDPKDRIEIEVGDSKQPDFKPQLKIMRWDNEVNFSIRAQEEAGATVSKSGEVIKYKAKDYEVHTYDKPSASTEGGHEFELYLKKKPSINQFVFTIETKELEYTYQPQLTQQEINEGAIRPAKVNGSYAVYHKQSKINRTNGKNYKTGKAFHIYRPRVSDGSGIGTWADLDIDEQAGTLTVTVDQGWLDDAIYPVVIDPTFGYTTAGASLFQLQDAIGTSKFSTGAAGDADSISVYMRPRNYTHRYRLGMYDTSRNKHSQTEERSIAAKGSPEWETFDYSPAQNFSDTDYYLAIWGDKVGGFGTYWYWDSGDTGQMEIDYSVTYVPGGDLPASFTNEQAFDRKLSIYATYTAGAHSISVYDDITVTEFLPPPPIQPYDFILVTEDVTVELEDPPWPDVYQWISVEESITLLVNELVPTVSDDIAITEDTTLVLTSYIDVNDSIITTEDVTVQPSTGSYTVNVNDEIAITEDSPVDLQTYIDEFDTITITEDSTVLIPTNLLSVFEGVTITESVTVLIPTNLVDESDTITITENVTILVNNLVPSVYDEVTVSESTPVSLESHITVSDNIVVSDYSDVAREGARDISVYEDITVSESSIVNTTDNPQVDVYDDITVTEDLTIFLTSYVNVNDSVLVTEDVTVLVNQLVPSVFDEVTVSELSTVRISIESSVYEEITITESSTVLVTKLYVNVYDDIALTEDTPVVLGELFISVSDDITLTESTTVSVVIYVDQWDTVTMEDALPFYHPETITITEDVTTELVGTKAVVADDDITITEDITILVNELVPTTYDEITITESTDVQVYIFIDSNDTVTITESISITSGSSLSAYEDITVTESTTIYLTSYISVSDDITLTENSTVLAFESDRSTSVSDDITITESVIVFLPTLTLSVYDDITITESSTVFENELVPSVSDDITLTESVAVDIKSYVNVSDDITVSEDITVAKLLTISVYDDVTLSESIDLDIVGFEFSINVSDDITITEDVQFLYGELNISVYDSIGAGPDELIYVVNRDKHAIRIGDKLYWELD